MGFKQILNRFELASIKRMINNAKEVSDYSHKNLIYVLFDMALAILNDNVGYMEYNLFNFINKTKEERKTYITFNESQKLFKLLNDDNYVEVFNDKLKFNEKFKDYIGREFIDIENSDYDDFIKYVKGKDAFFCKPKDSCSGKGIYKKIYIDENRDLLETYNFLKENKLFCEDIIIQHPKMNELNESSINTIRLVTVLKDEEVHIMYAILRVGRKDMSVDNVGSGGIYTLLEDGKIVHPFWSDKTIKTYTKHPDTNYDFMNFEVPYFKEAVELVKNAAKVEPHIRYVGWDIAISTKGALIVEGNQLPGYDMAQNYFVSEKNIGLKPEFEKILGKI